VLTAAWVIDERRPKAGDAGSGGAANARVDDPVRSCEEEPGGEGLGGGVALRNGVGPEAVLLLGGRQDMERAGEVGQELLVVKGEGSWDAGVGEKAAAVKGDLGEGGFKLESGIPGAAGGAVKAAAGGSGMGEGGVDDVGFRYAEEELAGTDGGIASALRDFALVGGGVELAEVGEDIGGEGQGFENAGAGLVGKASGDEAVGCGLVELVEMGHGSSLSGW
jgi:hypothetical protein